MLKCYLALQQTFENTLQFTLQGQQFVQNVPAPTAMKHPKSSAFDEIPAPPQAVI
jgi:hypothetical protein